ncbi:MAG: hypothetical protein Q8P18_00525 [Pseudomonadota bacterium]|nr:hypothetical protein [Pseudomonadota bacterium]
MGEVRTVGGAPVPGAVLSSPGCEAVTGVDGRFRVVCEEGTRSFAVTHPDHLDRTWLVHVEGAAEQPFSSRERDVGVVELPAIPLGEGLWLAGDGRLDRLPAAPLVRTTGKDDQRWCMDSLVGQPVVVPPGRVRLLDNHSVDWRVYALDADRCAYRMARAGSETWTFSASRIDAITTTPRGPGRDWVELELPPGDYAIVEWYEGFMVRAQDETWRGHWLRVEPQAAPSAGATAAETLAPAIPTASPAP